MPESLLGRGVVRLRSEWQAALASPGGPRKVARGVAAGAFAAMLPVFGLHLLVAGIGAMMMRGSLPAAAAVCLLLGNPVTHAFLVPLEYELGRILLPVSRAPHLHHGPSWLIAAVPAATEALLGGLILAMVVAGIAWALASRALRPKV